MKRSIFVKYIDRDIASTRPGITIFCEICGKGTFYVEEVHLVWPMFLNQNKKTRKATEIAQLVTFGWGTINSGSVRSIRSAEEVKKCVEKKSEHILCEKTTGKTAFGRPVCVVVPIDGCL